MTSDDFRTLFNKDRMMPVTLMSGEQTVAVGLNGENVILFRAGELPLAWFKPNPLDNGIFQHRFEAGPNDLVGTASQPGRIALAHFDLDGVAAASRDRKP